MNNIRIRLITTLGILAFISFAYGEDFEGQRFKLVEAYPGSEVVEFERDEKVTSRQVILGPLKKVNNALEPESSEFIRGTRTAITYRIRNERRTSVVQQFFKDQIVDGGQILFECEGRACGSSNDWSNAIFDRSILYGPAEFQHYILARMTGEATYYVAVYIARRGTGELYSHLDIVASRDADQIVDAGTINAALESRGKYVLPWLVDEKMIVTIADALDQQPEYRVAVVGHDEMQENESPREAMQRTDRRAADLKGRIVSAGVNESRLESFGLGPLAPTDNQAKSRFELVLLNNRPRAN